MYRLPKKSIPCKFGEHYNDWVPMPFGSGNCAMPGFECTYESNTVIPEDFVCDETDKCPAYAPVPTFICPYHDEEYFDICGKCATEYGNQSN